MPHNSLKLLPGVDQNKTSALNEAALSFSNLIRFVPDRNGIGLVQKLGGWVKYFPNKIGSIVRALWAWEDTNTKQWLAVGAEYTGGNQTLLSVISNGSQINITPQISTDSVSVSISTTSGSNVVTINDATGTITSYDTVYISTQISVGGLILYGFYPCIGVGPTSYEILATNIYGNPAYATSTVTNGGSTAEFATTSGSSQITVTLDNHTYLVGESYPILVPVTVGGITLSGNYFITSVTTNTLTFNAQNSATSTATAFQNGNNAKYTYYYNYGAVPAGTGYGVGTYGSGGYGTGVSVTPSTGSIVPATDWSLDNWGQILISCPVGGALYQWDPTSGYPVASVIPQAPVINDGFFVAMPQRQIIAWGSTQNGIQDPLLIIWCDIENFTQWIGSSTNQAGSFRIPKGSKIVGCIQGPQQGLIWTDLAVWSMQYIGQPYIYSFNEVGTGCGLIARKAAISMNGIVYWMGQSQFYMLGPTGVTVIPCPVWDVIFQDLDMTNLSKIRVAANSRFGEVAWYYPTMSDGGEVNAYVKYNVNLQTWDYGTLSRTAWINESVLGPPIGADSSQYIYQHETSPDADGQPLLASFQTGYFVLSEGDLLNFIDQVWPDMKWGYFDGESNGSSLYQNPTANVQLTFYVANYPGDTPRKYGPYSLSQATQFITPRFRGRLVSIQVNSQDIGSWWRIGNMRYRYQQDGKF